MPAGERFRRRWPKLLASFDTWVPPKLWASFATSCCATKTRDGISIGIRTFEIRNSFWDQSVVPKNSSNWQIGGGPRYDAECLPIR